MFVDFLICIIFLCKHLPKNNIILSLNRIFCCIKIINGIFLIFKLIIIIIFVTTFTHQILLLIVVFNPNFLFFCTDNRIVHLGLRKLILVIYGLLIDSTANNSINLIQNLVCLLLHAEFQIDILL